MCDKFEGVDFKYCKSFFKIQAQKNLNKAFLVSYLDIFILARNYAIREISGR